MKNSSQTKIKSKFIKYYVSLTIINYLKFKNFVYLSQWIKKETHYSIDIDPTEI